MLTDKDDIKIFVLYLLNKVGYPLKSDVLHDLSVQDGFITSFDFIEAYDSLLGNGNIEVTPSENSDEASLVNITDRGRHIAETLHVRLLASVREKAFKSALRMLEFKKSGAKTSYEITELPRGRYEFRCEIADKNGQLMELKLTAGTKKELDLMVHNFDNRPEFVYKGIFALVTGKADYLLD